MSRLWDNGEPWSGLIDAQTPTDGARQKAPSHRAYTRLYQAARGSGSKWKCHVQHSDKIFRGNKLGPMSGFDLVKAKCPLGVNFCKASEMLGATPGTSEGPMG
ncbi:hypothetical protein BBP40_007249 [Aspergillus hancockii]|nr:hypothetical protein BBP40_007249 [Aspergillus hancockii]